MTGREAALDVREISEPELPEHVILQTPGLREVLFDGRQFLEAAAWTGRGRLLAPVLEEFFPVDFSSVLLGLAFLAGRGPEIRLFRVEPGLGLGLGLTRGRRCRVAARPPFCLLFGEDRVVIELLADFVLELEARELQQPNRLLQLGGHHQLLGQAELLLEFHRSRLRTGPPKGGLTRPGQSNTWAAARN